MLSLRPLERDDYDLVYRIVETTMRSYVEQTFGPWVKEYQYKLIEERMQSPVHRIVQIDGVDAGLLAVERNAEYIHLDTLFLLPESQNKKIGTGLLRQFKAEASAAKVPLRLHVLACNPARHWYLREGFHITQTTPERIFMEYVS